MLKIPDHQVAGHQAKGGKLGPLVDESGHFYKPLQGNERGDREASFYTSFSSDTSVPDPIRRFFPVYHGTKLIEASDGSGMQPHLALQDLFSGRLNPSIMDIKIGSRTWYPESSDDYIKRCLVRDRESTGSTLGFRICGLRKYEDKETGFWKPDKEVVQKFDADDVRLTLRRFVSSNLSSDPGSDPDCSLAQRVYGGSAGILSQLLELKAWFEDQTSYHFNSCSVLFEYEKEMLFKLDGSGSCAEVKLVDFAHVTEGKGVIDHNFLGGLCSLIKFVSQVLASLDTDSRKAG